MEVERSLWALYVYQTDGGTGEVFTKPHGFRRCGLGLFFAWSSGGPEAGAGGKSKTYIPAVLHPEVEVQQPEHYKAFWTS